MLPYICESVELHACVHAPNLLIVDMGSADEYSQGHIPGAIHLDYSALQLGQPPAPGLLPKLSSLENSLRQIGLNANSHIIAYDHDNSAKACRLLWTLETIGHQTHSLLNGGMAAWMDSGFETEQVINSAKRGDFTVDNLENTIVDKEYVLQSFDNEKIQILDARSADEFNAIKSQSSRKGHIPGAINLDWMDTIDSSNSKKLKSKPELLAMVEAAGFSKDNEIIVHCQTHRRSSHSFVMLRSIGFKNLKAYPGSWSEWGNDLDLPIA